MRHLIGMRDDDWRTAKRSSPVILDTKDLINGHMLIAGMSGTGKSYQIMSLLRSCAREKVEVDVFDVHEELEGAPGAVAAKFSGATRLGFNPLSLSLDPHAGGVHRQIDLLVDMINRTSRQLGPRQESALRNLLLEVYQLRGIYPNDARSWNREQITEALYEQKIAARDYSGLRAYYPTLRDVLSYGQRKLKALSLGADNKAITALERVEGSVAKLQGLVKRGPKAITQEEISRLEKQLDNERHKAIEAYAEFIEGMVTGREFQDASKYTNAETIISILERLEALDQCGIFCANPPNWRGAQMRVHQIGALLEDQRRLLVYTRMTQILRDEMNAGKSDHVRRVVLLDEGHLYYSEDPENPINRIAKEGRKFGLSLVVGSQSPTHFSEDFLSNCGTVMLTGLHEQYWDMACRKLRIDRSVLLGTRPRETVGVKLHRNGEASARFVNVNVSHDVVSHGIQVIRSAAAA